MKVVAVDPLSNKRFGADYLVRRRLEVHCTSDVTKIVDAATKKLDAVTKKVDASIPAWK